MRIVIEGKDLPGSRFEGRGNVHVALQVGADPVGPVRGDGATARWETEADVTGGDLRGAAVHGRPGARFLYLTWGDPDDDGWHMFRRAKLMLVDVPDEVLQQAVGGSGALVGSISLTDEQGGPRCARVRPPAVEWSVGV